MAGLLWADTVVPGNIGNDAPGWTLGTVIAFSSSYTNVAIRARWWFPSAQVLSANALPANIGPVTARLYNNTTGALLGSATFPDTSAGAAPNGSWRESADFTAGGIQLAGLTVCIGMYKPTGYYPFAANVFPITGTGYTATMNRFATSDAAPNSAGSATAYYADLVTQAAASATVVARPSTGTTARPGTGTTARPSTGTTVRA